MPRVDDRIWQMNEEFTQLLARPAWHADALCKEYPELKWIVGKGGSSRRQKEICMRCLVREECLAFAVEHKINVGIWGGLGEPERRPYRRLGVLTSNPGGKGEADE